MDNPPKTDFLSSKKRTSFDDSSQLKKLSNYFGKELVDTTTVTPKLKLNAKIVYQGWMFKRKRVLSNWNERWFCICEDYTLRMISNDGLNRSVIDLSTMINPPTFTWNDSAWTGTIRLESVGRNWNFMVADKEGFNIWRNLLNNASKSSCNMVSHKVGWLEKRGLFNKGWRRRYCQLSQNGMFSYSKLKSSVKPQGHFFLNNSTILHKNSVEERNFSIEQPARTWFFRASSKGEAQQWCKAIRQFVNSSETQSIESRSVVILQSKSTISFDKSVEKKSYMSINSNNSIKSLTLKNDYFAIAPLSQKMRNLTSLLTPCKEDYNFTNDSHTPSLATGINSYSKNRLSSKTPVIDKAYKTETEESMTLEFESVKYKTKVIKTSKPCYFRTGTPKLNMSFPKCWSADSLVDKGFSLKQKQLHNQCEEKLSALTLSLTEQSELVNVRAPSTTHKTDISMTSLKGMADWTYEDALSNAFYRFAGVSPYSNTNLRMSKADLEILLSCLQLEEHCDDFYSRMEADRLGLVSIGEFMSACLEEDIGTRITNSKEYEFLVITLMTMKDVDPTLSKRISREDFKNLVDKFFDDDDAEQIFLKYDTDGVGQLHVANLFLFLRDCFDVEDEDEEEDEKYNESRVSQT